MLDQAEKPDLQPNDKSGAVLTIYIDEPLLDQDYRAALEVAQQWFQTWRRTGKLRHLDIAIACHRIARERLMAEQSQIMPPAEQGQNEILQSAEECVIDLVGANFAKHRVQQEFRGTLEIAQQWCSTWNRSGKSRHFETTLACQQIARQHFVSLMHAMKDFRDKHVVMQRQYQVEIKNIYSEIESTFESTRRLSHIRHGSMCSFATPARNLPIDSRS